MAAMRDLGSGGGGGLQSRKRNHNKGRTAKALKCLQFANPGRQTEFTPETSKREKRRLQTKSTPANSDSIPRTVTTDNLQRDHQSQQSYQ